MVTKTESQIVRSRLEVEVPQSRIHGRIITTKVVGVTFEDRQEAIARVAMGDRIWLERETNNPFDSNAISVFRNNLEQLGYLNRRLASNLVPYFDAYGKPVSGKVTLLTGGSWIGYTLGLVISFKIPKVLSAQQKHRKHQFNDWED